MVYSVYVFLDNRNRPYYVGKTNNMKRRRKEHLEEARKGNKLPKYNALRKLVREGHKFNMKTVTTTKNENEAYKIERRLIKKYIKNGYRLFNCTHGGPYEVPMRIKVPRKHNLNGIFISRQKKSKITKPKTSIKRKLRRRR